MFIKIGLLVLCAVLWNGVTTDGLSVFPTGCNPFLKAICDKRCLRIFYLPVCGSDGVTYTNNCYLSIAECLNGVTKVHNGKCRDLPIESGRDCKNVQFCYEIYTPVCGSDGKTYDNLCFLQQANCRRSRGMPRIFQDYNGQCKKPCDQIACTKDYRPVCGSDGVTYSNPCVLSVASCRATENGVGFPIVKAYDGSCKCLDSCITVYDPVCGSDGKTYSNGCFLGIASCQSQSQRGPAITINHKGECRKCIDICPAIYDPVCGSDGRTYSSSCHLRAANCKSVSGGGPKITEKSKLGCVCHDICPAIYAPVCGSDGKTYSSSCDLAAVSCKSVRGGGPEITEKNKGECVCNDICPEIYAPICGSDGKTYSNACFLEAARCKSVSEGGSEITEKSKGECVCNEVCTFIYEPICGSDGKTYGNACALESASCKSVSEGGSKITEKSKGECVCNEVCTFIYEPVCGSDGKTYDNACALESASCKSVSEGGPEITEKSKGECASGRK